MNKDSMWFELIMKANGIPLLQSQIVQLELYVQLLLDWNKKVNLISRKSEEMIWEEQILHSVSFLFHYSPKRSASVIDIGTGGGLPGIPLKIMRPDLLVTLLDSIAKKVDAVQDILSKLALSEITTMCGRAEDIIKQKKISARFDYAFFRGVGPLVDLWKYGSPLLRRKGDVQIEDSADNNLNTHQKLIPTSSVVALKGGDIDDEIQFFRKKYKNISLTETKIAFEENSNIQNQEKKLIILHSKD